MRLSDVIVFVGDMARSVAFYRDTLGLPLRAGAARDFAWRT